MSNLRVFMTPSLEQADPSNGIGRIIRAQYRYLPEYGIQFVDSPDHADVIHVHAGTQQTDKIDILSCHGLYWVGDKGSGNYLNWNNRANQKIIDSARKARMITVPSRWVGECFRRDMRIEPIVVGHGIDVADWQPGDTQDYVLWNKARSGDVCDPTPAYELARRGAPVWSTFAPGNYPVLDNLKLIGALPFEEMKPVIQNAGIYLATTQETFGIGTLEAMASGVPVLGFDWGGTAEIIVHKVTGYLVKPHDYDDLQAGYEWLKNNRAEISGNCLEDAQKYDWSKVIGKYADLYAKFQNPEPTGLAVVIPCHNYAQWVGEAITSCLQQSERPDEIIVVDDGSTDSSWDVISGFGDRVHAIFQENQGVAAARNHGIESTHQPFIICLDADDRLAPDYVKTVKAALIANRGLGIAYTGLSFINPDGTTSTSSSLFPPEFSWESQSTPHNPPSNCIPCAAAFRRSMWERAGGFKQIYAPGEDAEFWTRGLSVGFTARKVSVEGLFEYRMHPGSESRTKKYRSIGTWHPWMRDKQYPMGAPSVSVPVVRSYANPAVSVVIPVGPGHAQYLPAALDSLLGQTVRDWEVIVVDDTLPVVGQMAIDVIEPYPFVKLLVTSGETGGLGAGAARNIGIHAAKAPFVLFLDADDYLMPTCIDKMLSHARDGRYVFSDFVVLNADGTTKALRTMDYDRKIFVKEQQAHSVTALVPTAWAKDVGGFDPNLPGWEEYDFYMKLALKGYCGTRVPESLFGYRVYSGTRRKISQSKEKELYKLFRERYPLEVKMSGCCGGNADAILAAKQVIEASENPYFQGAAKDMPQGGMVRVEFIGEWTGPVEFHANGRVWYGANSREYKFQDMPLEDAQVLEKNGKFRIVNPVKSDTENVPVEDATEIQPTVMITGPVKDVEVTKFAPTENVRAHTSPDGQRQGTLKASVVSSNPVKKAKK